MPRKPEKAAKRFCRVAYVTTYGALYGSTPNTMVMLTCDPITGAELAKLAESGAEIELVKAYVADVAKTAPKPTPKRPHRPKPVD